MPPTPGRRALIGLDEGGVVVALDLEDDRLAVADIDDAGILARAADHARPGGRQGLQPDLRGFVGAVLAPHHREDAELGQVRRAAEDRTARANSSAASARLGGERRRDVAADCAQASAPTRPGEERPRRRCGRAAGRSRSRDAASGPSTVLVSLKMPAIARAEPLALAASVELAVGRAIAEGDAALAFEPVERRRDRRNNCRRDARPARGSSGPAA